MLRKALIWKCVLCCLIFVSSVSADNVGKKLGDTSDGSRAVPVHLIDLFSEPLLDEEAEKIAPDDDPLMPFSTRQTCSACHSYDIIGRGWHFNAVDPNVLTGRAGQPWIFVDAATGTQIPLSYRRWPGTFKPEQVGLTSRQFVQRFGRHMPGGGPGELDSANRNEIMRQFVSGKLEINCLSCHNAHPGQDQAEYADQIARQNFRWAATAACEFASVSGSAKKMPDTYDYLMPDVLDAPTVTYRGNTFDHKNRVFFDIVRKAPNERCYFCHSNVNVDENGSEKWTADEDVHLAAGMTCVDCHRNGLDHNIIRGYEGEDMVLKNPLVATTSCKGCHEEGRLGAPVPTHPGIPPVHFDKLTCTACHSGPWPTARSRLLKTSRAHGLGTHNVNKSPEVLPHIIYPVFAKQRGIGFAYRGRLVLSADGKIAPHNLLWPAFWGSLEGEKVRPINLEIVRQTVGKIIAKEKPPRSGDWLSLTAEHITKGLKLLSSKESIEGKAVYVSGGILYSLDDSGQLLEEEHSAAKPYLWPIGHNVRPAAQALGARRCEDCHATNAPFFFGEVAIDSALAHDRNSYKKMVEFLDVPYFYTKAFAFSFVFRPWLKVVTLGSCVVLAAVLLLYALKALACIAKTLVGKD